MTRKLGIAAVALCAVALVGCASGPVGTWTLKEMVPSDAERDFALRQVTFEGDGTYTAVANRDGRTVELAGDYEFDKKHNKLVFHDENGRTRTYFAQICGTCGYLEVSNEGKPVEWTAKMVRK